MEEYFKKKIKKYYVTRFLNRHPKLVSKLSSNFDKRRIKKSDSKIIQHHFAKLQQVWWKYLITNTNTYNKNEKGFQLEVLDRAKVICQCRERSMSGKMATNGIRELITVVETISGDGQVWFPLVIYKGIAHYMG